MPKASYVIDSNNIWGVLSNNAGTAWPTELLCYFKDVLMITCITYHTQSGLEMNFPLKDGATLAKLKRL